MEGMADGSGVPFDYIRNVNMFPEFIKAACTIAGTWSEATVN